MKYFFRIVYFYLCCFAIEVQAQEFTYFNKGFWTDSTATFSTIVHSIDDGYFILGPYKENNIDYFYIRGLDKKGDEQWFKLFEQGADLMEIHWGRYLTQTKDGNFVVCYTKQNEHTYGKVHLFKFDENGEEIWRNQLENILARTCKHIISTSDGGLAVVGAYYLDSDTSSYYITKLDNLGNAEWEQTYRLDGTSRAGSIQETPDNGYIVSGFAYDEETNYDLYVIKVDSVGNTIWERQYGGDESDCGGDVVVLTTAEEYAQTGEIEYLLRSCIERDDNDITYLLKIDDRGEIIWEKEHNLWYWGGVSTYPIVREDKSFVVMATFEKRINGYRTIIPLLIDFDNEGNINWTKEIPPDTTVLGTKEVQIYVRDFRSTPDGGYVWTGFEFIPLPQKSWVVKMDSLGNTCSYVGCDSTVIITNIPEFEQNNIRFSISPNPVHDQATVHYQLPLGKEGVLEVYDVQGRKMGYWLLDNRYSEVTLEVADWLSGVYFYRLEVEGERVGGGKLVVEN